MTTGGARAQAAEEVAEEVAAMRQRSETLAEVEVEAAAVASWEHRCSTV